MHPGATGARLLSTAMGEGVPPDAGAPASEAFRVQLEHLLALAEALEPRERDRLLITLRYHREGGISVDDAGEQLPSPVARLAARIATQLEDADSSLPPTDVDALERLVYVRLAAAIG